MPANRMPLFFTVVSVVIAMVADMTGQGGMLHRVELTDEVQYGLAQQPEQEEREGAGLQQGAVAGGAEHPARLPCASRLAQLDASINP